MSRRLFIILLGSLLAGVRIAAQSVDEGGFTRYTRMDGLSNNSVNGIAQDPLGYIWVATNKGLNRFDGNFFTCYSAESAEYPLPDNLVGTLKLEGREIVGSTGRGAFAIDLAAHRYKTMVVPCDSLISCWANSVWESATDGSGHYILSTRTGLYVFDSTGQIARRYDHYHPSDVGRTELWFGGQLLRPGQGRVLQKSDSALCLYDPATNTIDTLFGHHEPAFVKAVDDRGGLMKPCYSAKNGQVFIYNAAQHSLNLFDFGSGRSYPMMLPFNSAAELGSSPALFLLNDSLLAIASKLGGFYLVHYNAASHQLTLSGKKYFENKPCSVVFRDREGRLWVGTSDGLYKQNLSSPFFEVNDLADQEADLKNYSIRTIFTDHDHLFIGLRNMGGILVLDKGTKKVMRHLFLGRRDSCNNISFFFPYDRDTLWVGTQTGLFWLNRNTYQTGRVPSGAGQEWMYHHNCLAILEDGHHAIWVSYGRLNSVVHYDRGSRQFTELSTTQNPLLKITFGFSMAEDRDGNVWLAGDGLCRWNRAKGAVDTLIPFVSGTRLNNYMLILTRDEGNNLWLFSFNNGIYRYNCTENKMYLCSAADSYTDGVSSGIIHGHLWLGAFNGISAIDVRDYSSQVFSYADGLPTVATSTFRKGSWYDQEEDRFYYGAQHDLVSFKPDLSHAALNAPVLLIDRVTTSKGAVSGIGGRIELPYASNFVQLNFDAVNFLNPEDNQFSYRIRPGADSAWHALILERGVNFNDLRPGDYRLQVRLSSANNRWPEQVKEVQLTILPPFWERWWFIALSALAVAGVVLVIYRKRVAGMREKLSLDKQVAEYEMKALHAQMNPHFIFNALNSIREMILHEDNRNASRYLSRFARLIRLNLEHSRQTFITLQQNIEYLESYLEMEQLRFPDFSYRIEVSRELDRNEVRLAPMLIQPLVENAIWHGLLAKGGDKRVEIRFCSEGGKLVCEIEDNGIGIRQSMQNKSASQRSHQSMGIGNIRQRIAVLNEKYRITCSLTIRDRTELPDTTDTGTLITLVFPAREEELV
jgi:ligand-binding sensor domain-containing protein